MQDQMQQLLQLFHKVLESSKDYRIATISHIGYASVIGKYDPDITDPDIATNSLLIDRVMRTPKELADELLINFRWQMNINPN